MSKKNYRIFWGNNSFLGPQLFLEQPKLVRQCLALLGFFSICIIFQIKNESLTHTVNFGIGYAFFKGQGPLFLKIRVRVPFIKYAVFTLDKNYKESRLPK